MFTNQPTGFVYVRVAGPLDCNYLNPSFRFGKTGFYLACAGWNIDF